MKLYLTPGLVKLRAKMLYFWLCFKGRKWFYCGKYKNIAVLYSGIVMSGHVFWEVYINYTMPTLS